MKKLFITFLFCFITISVLAEAQPDIAMKFPTKDSESIDIQKLNPLSFYKPIYFTFGNNKDQVLVQLSFKAALLSFYNMGFFAGYSQQMWWKLYDGSSPFRETNYNPEFFWKWRMDYGILEYVQIGFVEHLSNGISGPGSRGLNRSYGQIQLSYGSPIAFGFNLKGNWTWDQSGDNPDILDYLGYYEAELFAKLEKNGLYTDKEKISVKWHTGKGMYGFDWKKGFVEVGLQTRLLIKAINPNVFLQFRYGYGESGFVDYNRKNFAVRLGLTLD